MLNINRLVALAVLFLAGAGAAAGEAGPERTLVTPHMEVQVTGGRNVVYCSTFQLAWIDMKNDVVGGDIRLEKPLELVRRLNSGRAARSDLSERDYVAMVGVGGDELVDGINRVLKDKFGVSAPQIGDRYRNNEIILAYAFLKKNLRFERPFDGFTKPVSFFIPDGRARVESFGVDRYSEGRDTALGKQVDIIDYKNFRNFIIRLASTDPEDEIILARVPPGGTLYETYEEVNSRVGRSTPEHMEENDVLMIPKLDVSIDHSYSSLLGLYLKNNGFEEYFVDEARQDISFRMDEYGLAVESQAKFVLEKKGPPPDHRLLVFNGPFMLYLKKNDGEFPYFVIWVENEELMFPRG